MEERRGVHDRAPDDDGVVVFRAAGQLAKGELRCAECGYGAIVVGTLPDCPMCRGTVWEWLTWSPLRERGAGAAARPR